MKKADWLSIVQAQFDHYREQLSEDHLTLMADMSVVTTTINMAWGMSTKDSITTGIQPFRFPDTDTEAYEQRNVEIELMLSGSTHTTLADARTILQAKLILPSNEKLPEERSQDANMGLNFLASQSPSATLLGYSLHQHAELQIPVGHMETINAPRTNPSTGNSPLQVPRNRIQRVLEVSRVSANPANLRRSQSYLQSNPAQTTMGAHTLRLLPSSSQGL